MLSRLASLIKYLDIEERPVRAGVGDLRVAEPRAIAPALVDVAADGQRGSQALDRRRQRGAAEVVAGARAVAVPLRRRVQDEHRALGAVSERIPGLLVGEVEA